MEARRIIYHGQCDLTVWLQTVNDVNPVIYPEWPEAADRAAVSLNWVFTQRSECQPILLVATSRAAMLRAKIRGRLWFCNMPISELLTNTDAKEGWFSGSAVSG